jgi:hypothetical protein
MPFVLMTCPIYRQPPLLLDHLVISTETRHASGESLFSKGHPVNHTNVIPSEVEKPLYLV